MSLLKKVLWPVKRIFTRMFGTSIDAFAWRTRHWWDHSWPQSYIESVNHPHRALLINAVASRAPFTSVLELGAASGPNCYLLAKRFPKAMIEGIDVSRNAVRMGNAWFAREGVTNALLRVGSAIDYLQTLSDRSIDVIITDATLIYVNPRDIGAVLKEICRVARKAVVLVERHHEERQSRYEDSWIHNYRLLLNDVVPSRHAIFTKISSDVWPGAWGVCGYVIMADFE